MLIVRAWVVGFCSQVSTRSVPHNMHTGLLKGSDLTVRQRAMLWTCFIVVIAVGTCSGRRL